MPRHKPVKITQRTADSIAREIIDAGHFPIPLEPRSKRPSEEGWSKSRITSEEVPARFPAACNVGILTGITGLADVDLDCEEAVALSDEYLPDTGWIWGRRSGPRSHRLYRLQGDVPSTIKMADPRKDEERGMLVELRTNGHQTIYPGSTHPSGEKVKWVTHQQPAEVEPRMLVRCTRHLAAACLIARSWDPGSRDEIAAALVGALDNHGWSGADIKTFLEPILSLVGDERVATASIRLSERRELAPQAGTYTGYRHLKRSLVWRS
jgi:Bifunctional DNA primase/polymerase, N-terminal